MPLETECGPEASMAARKVLVMAKTWEELQEQIKDKQQFFEACFREMVDVAINEAIAMGLEEHLSLEEAVFSLTANSKMNFVPIFSQLFEGPNKEEEAKKLINWIKEIIILIEDEYIDEDDISGAFKS